jgi:HK97 family phage portal protein
MSIWQTIKTAFRPKQATKKTGLVFLNTNVATWGKRDFLTYAREGYLENVIVFRCIQEIARAVGSVEWELLRQLPDGKKEIVHDPILTKILTRPNPNQGWSDFMFNACAFLVLDGTSFISKSTPDTGENKNIPLELIIQKPTQIEPVIKDNKYLVGYELKINGEVVFYWPIDPISRQSDLLRVKNFHPLDDLWGASATQAGAREIDTSNEAINWHKALLENQGRPGMLIMLEGEMGDKEFEHYKKQVNELHTGASNVGKNLILEGGAKAQPYNFSPTDLDFIEGSREKARNIAMGYGVPPQLIGIKGDSTFANYEQARLAFWEESIIWYLNLFKTEFNNWLYDDPDLLLNYNLDKIPALAEKRQKQWENAQKSDFITINEKRAMVGMEEKPGADVILVNSNLIPLADFTGSDIPDSDGKENHDQLLAIGYTEEEIEAMEGDGF